MQNHINAEKRVINLLSMIVKTFNNAKLIVNLTNSIKKIHNSVKRSEQAGYL